MDVLGNVSANNSMSKLGMVENCIQHKDFVKIFIHIFKTVKLVYCWNNILV